MANQDKSAAIKGVYKGLVILAAVTFIEVGLSLFGKGHLWEGAKDYNWITYLVGFGLIVFSLYKAYFIIYEFMHMGHEAKGLRVSVLLPTLLLVWALIAFFQEGGSWGDRRALIKAKDNIEQSDVQQPVGLNQEEQTKNLH